MASDVWSVTSFNELQRDGVAARRWNLLHPQEKPRRSLRRAVLARSVGVRASPRPTTSGRSPNRFTRSWAARYVALGTDGYGRSDFRRKLREFFEVDRHFVTLAALRALADEGRFRPRPSQKALEKYDIDPNKPNPITV